MQINEDCSFCHEIGGIDDYNFFKIYLEEKLLPYNIKNRIIGETKNFLIMPMVGPLVPGYLLVVSKEHYWSFSHLPKDIYYEVEIIQELLNELFERYFTKPLYFEHGAMSDIKKGGCCSVHAHLHCVGVEIDVYKYIAKKNMLYNELYEFTELSQMSDKNIPYIYYQNQNGNKFVFKAENIESQYVRKLIGKKLGYYDRLEWSENIQYDWILYLIKEFTPLFNKLKGKSIWL
jgi:diadenosine tetraphosphate (Ap4A) HIT family hydrolase